jgi:hypothetical protein
MQNFIKSIIVFIFIFSIGNINISYWDYFEDLLNLETWLQEIKYDFVELKNPNLKNIKFQKQFYILKTINPKIQKAILKQYKSKRFGYYQTLWLIEHYNNFIYYSNKYFSSLKNKEIYWDTKEVKRNIYNNFSNMKYYYSKFQNLAIQKDMN